MVVPKCVGNCVVIGLVGQRDERFDGLGLQVVHQVRAPPSRTQVKIMTFQSPAGASQRKLPVLHLVRDVHALLRGRSPSPPRP